MENLQQIKDLQLEKQSSSGSPSQTDQKAILFLKALVDLEKGLVSAEALLNGDVVKQVVSCLNSESRSTLVLEAATELVAALFSHDAAKKAVANKPRPIVDALFTCLRNNADLSVVQRHILTAIGNLTEHKDASQNWLVSDYDAINIIVGVLKQSPSLADLQAQAYYALQKIANGNKANISFLFNTQLAHQLAVTSMTNHATYIPLQTQGCALLRRLSFLPETSSVLMTTATATIIQSMRSFAAEPQIQEHGCVFIGNVGRDADHQKLLVREPYLAHQVILFAMHNHPQIAAVQEKGCAALLNLACDDDNEKLLVREPHFAHQAILSAMRNHPQIATVQEEGCATLWSLAVNADNRKVLVREPHLAHQAILSAMRNHPQIVAIQQEGCGALWKLAMDADNQKLLVREPHLAHQAVLSAMRNHPQNAAVQAQGCSTICDLAVDDDDQKLLVQSDAHTTVIAALKIHPQDERVQLQAIWALSYLSIEVSNRTVLKQADPLPLCEKAQRNFPDNRDLNNLVATLNLNLA